MKTRFHGMTFQEVENVEAGLCPKCLNHPTMSNVCIDESPVDYEFQEYYYELLIVGDLYLNIGYTVDKRDPDNKAGWHRARWEITCTKCGFTWGTIHGN